MVGKTLNHYEVIESLGAGGMGEVYRARDTKLARDVAVKVLPPHLADDSERLARMQREAQLLAALNHPNIAAIYGLEDADGVHFLAMELAEGQTLAQKLSDGALGVDEALKIALQIAEALESAHEAGIVHRDLKPANVQVATEGAAAGQVKVLDFGLAKAYQPDGTTSEMSPDLSASPTMAAAATATGMIMGTAAYMSPEQARGKALDKRTDIWAFGCVVFETLTGKRTFQGETVTDILAAIVHQEPQWEALPPDTPLRIRELLARCLKKQPEERLRDVGECRIAVREYLADPEGEKRRALASAGTTTARRPAVLPVAAAAAVIAMFLTGLAAWTLWPTPEPGAVSRFAYVAPADQSLGGNRSIMALSRDGRAFVYKAGESLYLRRMDDLEATVIQGIEGFWTNPFFSFDGQSVGYWQRGEGLRRIAISGGTAELIGPADQNVFGASWEADDTILFGQRQGIMRVPATGGTPVLVIPAAEDERLGSPTLLPGGDSVLFHATPPGSQEGQIFVQSLSTRDRTVVVPSGRDPRYLPTGHLVYSVENDLYAVAFDPDSQTVSGGAVNLEQGVGRTGAANYGVSEDGTLVYLSGASTNTERGLLWVGLDRQEAPLRTPPGGYVNLSLSPGGDRAALEIEEDGESDVWVTELTRGGLSRITRTDGFDGNPLWSPDGRRVVFTAIRDGRVEIQAKAADGTGDAETLATFDEDVTLAVPFSWSPDGTTLAIEVTNPDTRQDIGLVPADGSEAWTPLIQTAAIEADPMISPDGQWIAYNSNDAGLNQIYIERFPTLGDRRPVSVGSSAHWSPTWSRDGSALIYFRGDSGGPNALMRATVTADASGAAVIGAADLILDWPYWARRAANRIYDVSLDGEQVLVIARDQTGTDPAASRQPFVIIQNWVEELKRLVPTGW